MNGEFESTKDLVVELLVKNGTLDALKAQLRASVFLALQNTPEMKSSKRPRSALGALNCLCLDGWIV